MGKRMSRDEADAVESDDILGLPEDDELGADDTSTVPTGAGRRKDDIILGGDDDDLDERDATRATGV